MYKKVLPINNFAHKLWEFSVVATTPLLVKTLFKKIKLNKYS